jgi:ABC-type branched-subunit amino acid transport system substrate-binding protein
VRVRILATGALGALVASVALVATSGAKIAHQAAGTVTIGVVAPKGTPFFNLPSEIGAVKAAARTVNATGGWNGTKLKVVYCNDKGDPNTTAQCARDLISKKAVAVFGGALLNGGTVLTPALKKAGIPQIGLTAISGPEFNTSNIYLFGTGGNVSYSVLAAWAATRKIPTSIVYTDNPSSVPLVNILKDIMKQKGQSFTAEVPVGATTADFSPLAQKAASNGSKAVLMFMGPEQGQAFYNASVKAGFKGTMLTAYAWNKKDVANLGGGDVLSRSLAAVQLLPASVSSNALVRTYVKSINAEAAAGDKDASVGGPGGTSDYVSGGWLGVWAMQQIAKQQKLKTITAKTVVQALNKTKNLDMRGVMPPWTPNKKGVTGYTRDAGNDKYFFFTWKSNVMRQLNTTPYNVSQLYAGKAKTIPVP